MPEGTTLLSIGQIKTTLSKYDCHYLRCQVMGCELVPGGSGVIEFTFFPPYQLLLTFVPRRIQSENRYVREKVQHNTILQYNRRVSGGKGGKRQRNQVRGR